ncbi:MAG TPA: BlaI/MecI/CopY family transcriptional regulator [Thermoanaerobaculia bacterium]|jgi:BlaI family penicillinase repressor|nr:BlaI/MecI/CopY family transcriptional regulator [Thermoanaerobaculia bacterium]
MPTPPITDAEWELMNVLWEGPRSALEIADALERHPKTVKTLLGRLVRKGVLRYREEGNRFVYSPAIPRQRYIKEASASFIERVFGGETTPALVHFVRSTKLTSDEIDELRRLLDEKQESER